MLQIFPTTQHFVFGYDPPWVFNDRNQMLWVLNNRNQEQMFFTSGNPQTYCGKQDMQVPCVPGKFYFAIYWFKGGFYGSSSSF